MANVINLLVTIVLVRQLFQSARAQSCFNGNIQLSTKLDPEAMMPVNRTYVQYCIGSTWRTLCTEGLSRIKANVVCRQLGYSDQGAKKGRTDFGNMTGNFFMLSEATCAGGENTLAECQLTNLKVLDKCLYFYEDNNNKQGWVECSPAACTDGEIRLVGGSNIRQGRVEVCQNKRWGTMCYNQALAGHVCSQLGFPSTRTATMKMNTPGPQVSCTMDTNSRLSCGNITDSGLCAEGLAIECPSFCETCPNSSTLCKAPSDTNGDTTATSALGAVIGLLVLLEIGTVIAWVACTVAKKRDPTQLNVSYGHTVTRKRNSSPSQRDPIQVNESYTDTALIEPSYSSLGPNYNTVTTSDKAIDDYDVIDHKKPNPKPANPPPVKVEASKSEDEFYNAEEHMYAAVNKEKKK